MFDFVLSQWNAWSENLTDETEGLHKPKPVTLPDFIPKMLQRRFSPLAKAVFQAAAPCIYRGEAIPCVLSSAHGELAKSLAMLRMIQAHEELSPTAFSLSVHNAIAGLFSMAYHNQQEMTVIAPGQEGIAPAFIEALGLLSEGHQTVLIILYDEPVPDFYPTAPFLLDMAVPCALALRVTLNGAGLPLQFSYSPQSRDDGEHAAQLMAFLNFLNSKNPQLHLGQHGHSWIWRKLSPQN